MICETTAQRSLETQLVGPDPVRKQQPSKKLYELMCVFSSLCIPEEGSDSRDNFWQTARDYTHPRAELDDNHRLVLLCWMSHLPAENLGGIASDLMKMLDNVLSGREQIADVHLELAREKHIAIRDERDVAQKEKAHLFAGERFKKLGEALGKVADDYGVTLTIEQPKVRDDLERYAEQEQLMIKITNLNMQLHWTSMPISVLEFVHGHPWPMARDAQLAWNVMRSILALLDVNAGLIEPSRESWIEAAQADIMKTLQGAAARAAEPS